MSAMSPDVIVIGAGVAGLNAAVELSQRGARVCVLEAKAVLGGRATAFNDPLTGERVDNGQHVLLGCYRETFRLLDAIGTRDRVRLQSTLDVEFVDRTGRGEGSGPGAEGDAAGRVGRRNGGAVVDPERPDGACARNAVGAVGAR